MWDQPLGDTLHSKLNRLVGPEALHLEFDTTDADFVMALTSKWPMNITRDDHLVFDHVGLMKLADVMNALVRLYVMETGHTFVHIRVEARRGIGDMPSWWADAPCLFVTYGFDTQQGQVCFADSPASAFGIMRWLDNPHRLLLAVGPGTPAHLRRDDGDVWADADAEHLQALQRWERQLSQQLARLLSFTDGGGMFAEEALVDALSTMRGHAGKVRTSIIDIQQRRKKPRPVAEPEGYSLTHAVHDLKSAMQMRAGKASVSVPERAALRRSLGVLEKLENSMKVPTARHAVARIAPSLVRRAAVRRDVTKQKPVAGMAKIAVTVATTAGAEPKQRAVAIPGKKAFKAQLKKIVKRRPMRPRKRKALASKKMKKKSQGIIGYYDTMNEDVAWPAPTPQ